ncbi:uncharacterized protein LOC119766609 [Culex quinquefasciatus]|uniref:uncharacterized protein LOC119766609 n=1 Tax=Culex quinquefasciatus TaxID=7176 RepID=UPI0018E2E156|nr:uncharacterized protein LOC119766609 [Culex quinquefasciatus]
MTFDFIAAACLVQPFDGSVENLPSFIDSVKLLAESTPHHQMPIAAKFVKTRLVGKACSSISSDWWTIEDLIDEVKTMCLKRETPEYIIAKLRILKQKEALLPFCEQVVKLTNKLEMTFFVSLEISRERARAMAITIGVQALVNGSVQIHRSLDSHNFSTIEQAVTEGIKMTSEYSRFGHETITTTDLAII